MASAVRHFGQPEVYGTVTVGLLAAGSPRTIPESPGRAAAWPASLALAGGSRCRSGKSAFGRPRPEQSLDADGYSPVLRARRPCRRGIAPSPSRSPPRWRTTSTGPWATVGLYGLATAVAWSRVNDNRHWLTDVAAGALVGITSAKLASGRWRIFGLRTPSISSGRAGRDWGGQGSF